MCDLQKIGNAPRRTGHHYITLFVDLLKRQTIFIAEGKDLKTVNAFVDVKAHNGDPDNITDVSYDMSPVFIKGVNKLQSHHCLEH